MSEETGAVALITGAGSGIGRCTAVALSKTGWRIALAGRRREALESVAGEINQPDTLVCPTDVSDEHAVEALFQQIYERFGRLDLLFNNAGTGAPPTPTEELPVDVWRHVVEVNLTGSFLCARAAMRLMKQQEPMGGRIINNGSISAHAPRPDSVAYTATKHAITGLTKSIALDGRAANIACGQIDVGNAATGLAERMAIGVRQADGSVRPEATMDPDDVARAVVYMASLPLDTNVLFMTVMATTMPFMGRG